MTFRRVHVPVVLLALLCAGVASAQNPGRQWMRYKTPEDAGWSSKKLTSICRVANANAVLLVHRGKVVFAYGQYWRRTKGHSLRKSFLGALYGVAVRRGKIDTVETLARLGMKNNPALTETEKQARIIDLLASRSGVYLPSGQETKDMSESRPARGSHRPGTSWYYNNWDFNVLGAIFRQLTNRDIFEAFQADITEPLKMEDFRRMDGVYEVSPADSLHPGYMFKMSARDAARFGQLYLQNGVWDGTEVVPHSWVERSTTSYSATANPGTSYGLLWWVVEDFRGVKMYYAAGYGGQRICVIPASDIVIVINSDTYGNNTAFDVDYVLPDLVFAARVGDGVPCPEFVPLEEPPRRCWWQWMEQANADMSGTMSLRASQ
jgi:CubicO group peptidase (beta-lactamase class C family)